MKEPPEENKAMHNKIELKVNENLLKRKVLGGTRSVNNVHASGH